jgi:ABC-type phosphate/phosphonate transport system substrate-binding protein
MIASLGMYDRAETQGANDRLWALIRNALRDASEAAPEVLTRGEGAYWSAWQSPDLCFSQTCGFPYRAKLHREVTLIGTPDYGVEGCAPGHYVSVYVARANDPRKLAEFDGAHLAYNEALSHSGWAAPQTHANELGLRLLPWVQSGSHSLSAKAVAEGDADIAAIDAVTWELLSRYDTVAAKLRKVTTTSPATPGLPYITAKGRDADLYFAAIQAAISALSPQDRSILMLRGLVRIDPGAYLAVPLPPSPEQIAQPK